jgi:bacterioferritin
MSVHEKSYKHEGVLELLARIYKAELAGVNRYLHYSFMIMGYNRIPIQKWFRGNAQEGMDHAIVIGEKLTSLGGHPPLISAHLDEGHSHSVSQLLAESLAFEEEAIVLYKQLVALATELGDIALEEMAREFVRMEVEHADEVRKMMRRPDA